MKKVLGLDLGVGSIGWALVNVDETHAPVNLLGMGSRIVPLTTDDAKEFTQGNAASKNQKRTQKRTARKGYDRYQLRRQQLTDKLRSLGMLQTISARDRACIVSHQSETRLPSFPRRRF